MKLNKPILILIAIFVGAICSMGACDSCGDDDDDDSGGKDHQSQNCQAEQSCYDVVAGCISECETVAQLLECLIDLETCLLSVDSCHNEYLSCATGCTSEECVESCVVDYSSCFDTCGWNYSCVDDCNGLMDTCVATCGDWDFDCWFTCYTDGFGNCMETCF